MQLSLKDIKKAFGDRQVLDGVSFSADSGKAFGLLGRNGAGKTTSIRIMMSVFPADGGRVLLDGRPIDRDRTSFGYLPEERGLYPKKPIIDQLVYFARLHGLDRAEAVRAADRWLARLDVSEYRNKRLDTLSKGNQQKIQLITALIHDPHIIILDEPFSGLDPVNAQLLKDVVREEIGAGKIVLFSSHQMNYIEEFCDDIAILNHGRIVLSGSLADIKRSYPRDRIVIRSPQAADIAAGFGGVPAGTAVLTHGEDSVTIKLAQAGDKQMTMNKLAARYDIDEMKVFEPSLNDIFVEYAGDRQGGEA